MKFLSRGKDGGPDSTVTGYWLIELKRLLSVVLLRFDNGSRDEYHDHAFGSLNWVIRGRVMEQLLDQSVRDYTPSWRPVVTRRNTSHRVISKGTTWVLSFRGPWARTWREYNPKTGRIITLTHGRKEVSSA